MRSIDVINIAKVHFQLFKCHLWVIVFVTTIQNHFVLVLCVKFKQVFFCRKIGAGTELQKQLIHHGKGAGTPYIPARTDTSEEQIERNRERERGRERRREREEEREEGERERKRERRERERKRERREREGER